MATQYTIRLNLGGNLVQRLAAAEASMRRMNGYADAFNRRTIRSGGLPVFRERYSQKQAASPTIPAVVANNSRLATSNAAWRSYQRQFLTNMLYPAGMMRNITGLGGVIESLGDAAGMAVPQIKAVTTALKAGLALRFGSTVIGGAAWAVGSKMMNSGSMTKAISDRMQMEMAERGLGGTYGMAYNEANRLAAEYGYSRAGILSTINTLSGFRTEKGEIGYDTATELARIIGKISQLGGRPYDIVSLNMQQIMASEKPNMRDIRELLHAAPILSKYALKEMAKMGKSGDPRDWLKDRDNMIYAMRQLDRDFQAPSISAARGRVQLARENFWIGITRHEQLWEDVGWAGEKFWGLLDKKISAWYSRYDSESMRKNMGQAVTDFTNALCGLAAAMRWAAKFFAIFAPIKEIKYGEAKNEFNSKRIEEVVTPIHEGILKLDDYQKYKDTHIGQDSIARAKFDADVFNRLRVQYSDSVKNATINPYYERVKQLAIDTDVTNQATREQLSGYSQAMPAGMKADMLRDKYGISADTTRAMSGMPKEYMYPAEFKNSFTPSGTRDQQWEQIKDQLDFSKYQVPGGNNDTKEIENLTKGSRALVINFNGPIVEMPTTIENAENPAGLMDRIAQQIEDMTTRGIRIALANATSMV